MIRFLSTILILIIFLGAVFIFWAVYLPVSFSSDQDITFLVKKGEGAKEMSINLGEQELIRLKSLFRIYILLRGDQKNLKAGSYLLSKSMNIPKMVNKFVSGDIIKNKITIIEGWNLRDIGWHFENKEMFQAEELFELAGFPLIDYSKAKDLPFPQDFSEEFDFLADKPENIGLEGYLFPDTYEFSSEADIEEIVKIMLNNFNKKLTLDLKEEIAFQKKSIFEIITMASLLEKEVRTFEDKKIVSGVLWNRLGVGVPLQVDATVSYITGKRSVKVSKEETQIDSYYNTYKYRGLPLGPIASPGLESIKAAIYPKDSDYFYYLSTPEGETIFSRTLEEHNIAKAKYLK